MDGKPYSSWMLERIAIGDTVRLRLGATTIGRHSSRNIRVLDAAFVSRHHAIIVVAEDDESVSIQDVSSNGIFVNERRYDKETVEIKNNDLIGIGVSPTDIPEDADLFKLPIYQLKYAPIRKLQVQNTTKFLAAPKPKPVLEANIDKTTKNEINKRTDNNTDRADQKPCGSRSIKAEEKLNNVEIFEISDDEDESHQLQKPKINQIDMTTQQKPIALEIASNEDPQKSIIDLNKHIEHIIKNETFDEKDYINPSQKTQDKHSNEIILNTVRDKDVDFIKASSQISENINSNAKDVNDEKEHNPNQQTSMNSSDNKEEKKVTLHVPIISNLKKERLQSVSADIQNIFGDIDGDVEIQKTIKEINPLVYNEIHISNKLKPIDDQLKTLNNGDLIVLTDDEDLEDAEVEDLGTIIPNMETEDAKRPKVEESDKELLETKLPTEISAPTNIQEKSSNAMELSKSPNIFDSSLENSKEELGNVELNQNNEVQKTSNSVVNNDNVDLDEYTKYMPNSDDEDIEDLMFSQVLINDMKAELQDKINDQEQLPYPDMKFDNQAPLAIAGIGNAVVIKQEPCSEVFSQIPKELENSCWIISDDDEDYDEELETKVNDWSNKIFSQSFNSFSQNLSQVYDIAESEKNNDNEEEDSFEEDNLSLLEDDLDGIANIYNSIEDVYGDAKVKSPNDEMKNAFEQSCGDVLNNELVMKNEIKEDNKDRQEKQDNSELKKEKNKEINQNEDNSSEVKISSIQITDCSNNFTQSPILRIRRISKTNPVIESSSSSEDELELKNKQVSNDIAVPDVDKITTRVLPPVIDAPSLPKHKGKHRGVSAQLPKKKKESANVHKTLNTIREKIQHECYTKDLKRKWLEKPSTAKKRDKERQKLIKECRKDKLKELAERKKDSTKESTKRKLSTEGHEHKAKVAKVKVTTHNRGAFLANNDPTLLPPPPATNGQKVEQINQFKIPKIVKKSKEPKKDSCVENKSKYPLKRSLSVDGSETFSQQITKPDILLVKQRNSETKKCEKPLPPAPIRRHSTAETLKSPTQPNLSHRTSPPPKSSAICKDAVAARAIRTTNKITFASMEKNIVESEENKRKLSALRKSTLSTAPNSKKKTVRFNDTPIIHYIERVTGACKKIDNKDVMPMTTYKDRRQIIRAAYPIIDHTDTIISKILCWSNEWLIKRNAAVDAASDLVYPMPTQFNSFEHYKSIIFPLMKLEFISALEREYNTTKNSKNFKVSLEYATNNTDRIMLVTKALNSNNKEFSDSGLYDLVILEPDKKGPQMFAFVVANRKGAGTFVTIVYEIIAKNFTLEYFKAIKEFNVRPVMDKVRVHFGAFNSVYQLQHTPLFQKIINPLELLKSRPPPKKKVIYRGFDKLNDKQRQILLNTYIKIIDESTPNITLIQGPPGTGKSCVIVNLVLQTLYGEDVRYLDKKILICAQSNAAVDVIAGKLYDISMRMRPEKRFRLIRYGMLNKMHPSVLPIALQKVVEHDQLKKLQAKNKNMKLENKENLKSQILQFEAQIAEMSSRCVKGTVEEDLLIEKKRQLQLMRNILNENMRPEDERSLFSWYLCNANIICATLSSCVNLSQYINFFDVCIIDEATQCTEPWTLLPLKFGINSLVLVGDTQQLPATVLSKKANDLGLGTSMFTRIQQCLDSIPCTSAKGSKGTFTTPNNIICSLQTQYRMHPEICRWPNQYFYRNELINDKSTIDFNKSPLVPFCILNLTYTQNTSGINGKISNNLEAEFVAKLLKALDGFIPNKYNSYGVITPYAHHRTTLESSIRNLGLTNIMVNTIDSYQGLEKNVIVISNARTSGIGFLSNPQRLNVALTRAKKCLILCGNFKNFESVPAWRCLLENARERKLYHEISANCVDDMQTNVIDKIKLKNQNQNQ